MKRSLSLLLALLLALALCAPAAAADGADYAEFKPRALAAGETLRRGIDVSQYQGEIDWKAVADSGVEFAFIRVGIRGPETAGVIKEDTRYKENLAGARKYGILVGAYIHSQALTTTEAREEARFVAQRVEPYGLDLPIVDDLEFFDREGGFYGRLYDAHLAKQAMTNNVNAFCDEVEKLGCEAMLYSNQFMLSSYLLPQQIDRLWLANHVEETSYAGSYEFWQCSHTGRIPGISYAVDLDFWFDPGTGRRPVMTFSDVASGYWAYDDLSLAVALGWVSGYPDNTFRPTATLTRADFVTLLARLSGEDLSGCTGSMFPDVTPGKYYAPSVVWAVRVGIVSGFPDGTFRPNENVTRQQMARIMRLYLRHKGTDVSRIAPEIERQIADLDMIGKWALDDVLFCYGENLLQGRSGSFVPAGTATRAEAAVVLTRLFRYENGEDPIPVPVEPIETPATP